MHIGFLASFHAISPERSGFSKIATLFFLSLVALKLLVSLISRLVACSPRIECAQTDRRTDRTTTVTLAAHARRVLIMLYMLKPWLSLSQLQHIIFIISAFLAWLVPDVPQSVKNEIQNEKLLAFEAIQARQDAGKDLGIKGGAQLLSLDSS